jgi:hypothetical protein
MKADVNTLLLGNPDRALLFQEAARINPVGALRRD